MKPIDYKIANLTVGDIYSMLEKEKIQTDGTHTLVRLLERKFLERFLEEYKNTTDPELLRRFKQAKERVEKFVA